MIIKICQYCGKEFQAKKNATKFCSNTCKGKNQVKSKKKYICDCCGKEFERLASQVNGKHNIYCSRDCQSKGYGLRHRGENHHRYNPNLTDEDRGKTTTTLEYIEWRKQVFERDSYTCQHCGDNKGGNLNAHHKNSRDSFPEEKYNIDNGVTLCESCHKDFHHEYGYGHNTIEQFQKWNNL